MGKVDNRRAETRDACCRGRMPSSVFLAGALVLLRRRYGGKDRLLALALNNMSQGVVMFDAAGRLVV